MPGFCLAGFYLEKSLDCCELSAWRRAAHLFWVEVYFVAGHVLCQAEDLHLLADGGLNDFLEGVFCMAWAELPGVAVVREGHFDVVLSHGQRCSVWPRMTSSQNAIRLKRSEFKSGKPTDQILSNCCLWSLEMR